MPISDRDYMRGHHPANCTCVDCVNERRRQFTRRNRRRSFRLSLPVSGFFASWYGWALGAILVAVILALIFL